MKIFSLIQNIWKTFVISYCLEGVQLFKASNHKAKIYPCFMNKKPKGWSNDDKCAFITFAYSMWNAIKVIMKKRKFCSNETPVRCK